MRRNQLEIIYLKRWNSSSNCFIKLANPAASALFLISTGSHDTAWWQAMLLLILSFLPCNASQCKHQVTKLCTKSCTALSSFYDRILGSQVSKMFLIFSHVPHFPKFLAETTLSQLPNYFNKMHFSKALIQSVKDFRKMFFP